MGDLRTNVRTNVLRTIFFVVGAVLVAIIIGSCTVPELQQEAVDFRIRFDENGNGSEFGLMPAYDEVQVTVYRASDVDVESNGGPVTVTISGSPADTVQGSAQSIISGDSTTTSTFVFPISPVTYRAVVQLYSDGEPIDAGAVSEPFTVSQQRTTVELVIGPLAFGGESGNGDNGIPVAINEWTWISGSDSRDENGTYGTLGESDPANVPGARADAVSWYDGDGNLWLFGGLGYGNFGSRGRLNDLWRFDLDTEEWTWISGSDSRDENGTYGTLGESDPANVPGARADAVSWYDGDGNLWLFGGFGYDNSESEGRLNDLWRFDLDTKEWTWISGSESINENGTYGTLGESDPANVPGARSRAVSWYDSDGNLWLFGGRGRDNTGSEDRLNDLWRFDLDTKEWTWISGSDSTNENGTYGAQRTPSSENVPGAREYAVSWRDSDGNLWLFGGSGRDNSGSLGRLNDLWRFDLGTKEWTWISGSDSTNENGTYGTLGDSDPANVPGARALAVSWYDGDGNLWLFGGLGRDILGSLGGLNDLWRFDLDTEEWTWISGSDRINQRGTYGTQGTPSPENVPGARERAGIWYDSDGNLWLFGGFGFVDSGTEGRLNDLWRYTP